MYLCYIKLVTVFRLLFHVGSRYNPYVQARSRIDQLKRLGHSVDKVWLAFLFYTLIFII